MLFWRSSSMEIIWVLYLLHFHITNHYSFCGIERNVKEEDHLGIYILLRLSSLQMICGIAMLDFNLTGPSFRGTEWKAKEEGWFRNLHTPSTFVIHETIWWFKLLHFFNFTNDSCYCGSQGKIKEGKKFRISTPFTIIIPANYRRVGVVKLMYLSFCVSWFWIERKRRKKV